MGQKTDCTCHFKRRAGTGVAHLETDELIFRGEFRLAIPYLAVESATSSNGKLTIVFSGNKAVFDLGEKTAAKWADKINDPPSLMKKLGVKPESAVGITALDDDHFVKDLRVQAGEVAGPRMKKDRDIIFFGAEKKTDLAKLEKLKSYLKPEGAIWVIRPKGIKAITENDVMVGGKKAGLVDVKVARFSDTHTAEKFVIPKSKR